MTDELKPGAETDRLVAEKVMGWKWYRCQEKNSSGQKVFAFRPLKADGKPDIPEWWEVHPVDLPYGEDVYLWGEPPSYSTRIADAWEVVEAVCKRVSLETLFCIVANEDGTWEAEFGISDAGIADTAPLAICKAALLAVGVKHG